MTFQEKRTYAILLSDYRKNRMKIYAGR